MRVKVGVGISLISNKLQLYPSPTPTPTPPLAPNPGNLGVRGPAILDKLTMHFNSLAAEKKEFFNYQPNPTLVPTDAQPKLGERPIVRLVLNVSPVIGAELNGSGWDGACIYISTSGE